LNSFNKRSAEWEESIGGTRGPLGQQISPWPT
jgi:hypothetical protein